MQAQLRHSIAPDTQTGWILDCDTTVKVLYGHQDGAVVSYDPQKPGRPSHTIHTYWIGNLRLVLDAQLQAGNRHSPSYGRAGLKALLESARTSSGPSVLAHHVRTFCVECGKQRRFSLLHRLGRLQIRLRFGLSQQRLQRVALF